MNFSSDRGSASHGDQVPGEIEVFGLSHLWRPLKIDTTFKESESDARESESASDASHSDQVVPENQVLAHVLASMVTMDYCHNICLISLQSK